MLSIAIVLLAVTAVVGLVLASKVLTGKLPSWVLSLLHALLGGSALVILLVISFQGHGAARVTAAIALLVVAALGGFFLATFHVRNKLAPKALVIIHAGVAVVGFLTLLSFVFGI